MAQVTPASIIYTTPEGAEQIIDFHAVISEGHETSATITKYPVATGLHISNHSIRHNRVVTLEGVISNVRLNSVATQNQTTGETDYGTNATKTVKAVLDALIQNGIECRVVTNLGDYFPVVFSKFKTKQGAGLVDSMRFTITGEEIVKYSASNTTAPAPITFTVVNGPARVALVDDLAASGFYVDDCDKLSQGSYVKGDDFVIDGVDSSGKAVKTTYLYGGLDPATGSAIYEMHVSESAVAVETGKAAEAEADPCAEESFGSSLLGGLEQIGMCLFNSAVSVGLDFVEDTIDTAMGKLQKSSRGAFYDTVTMDNSYGQSLASAGIGCVVRGVTGEDNTFDYVPGNSLPTTGEIMSGASQALGFSDAPPEVVTLTQIMCDCKATSADEVDNDTIPIG
tara:strand:+ start:4876 stop:6063 length:1188 start_codon:yes stop_codon:yes gene_type:complete